MVDAKALASHLKTKVHKKRVKLINEQQYTQKEAEEAAGMGTDNGVASQRSSR